MGDDDVRRELDERGLVLDEGNLISGPFIPDGTVRIYHPDDPCLVLGEGATIKEAFEDLEMRQEACC
jgi:hypothetical protein